MSAVTFDTLKFVETLIGHGIPNEQAKGIAEAFKDAHAEGEIATQDDIALVRQDIRELELRMDAKISDIKFDMVKWMAGMLLAQAGLVAALVKLL